MIVESSETASKWFRSTITPWDMRHVVESSDDLQIERMGTQVVASVCLLLGHFIHFSFCIFRVITC